MPDRLAIAILAFALAVGLADMQGWGHGYLGLVILIGYFFLLRHATTRTQSRIVAALLTGSVLMLPLAILQMWFMPRARGVFISPNFLGGYAALNIFLALSWYARGLERSGRWWLRFLFVAANLAMLLLSQSRGAMVAALLGGGATLGNLKPRLRAGLLFAGLGLIAATSLWRTSDSITPRLSLWRLTFESALAKPLFGWGQYGLQIGMNGMTAFYNIPLEWFAFSGIVGLLAAGWMLWEAWRRADAQLRALGVAWFVNGLFMFTRPETSLALFTAMALVRRDVARVSRVVDKDKPLLDGRVRAGRPQ